MRFFHNYNLFTVLKNCFVNNFLLTRNAENYLFKMNYPYSFMKQKKCGNIIHGVYGQGFL